MRQTLLASATLMTLACAFPAFAQTPDQPAAPTDNGVATDAPAATGTTAPAKPAHHSHHIASTGAADGGQTFPHDPGTGQSGPAAIKPRNI